MYASNGVPNDKFSMISQMYDRLMTWLEDGKICILQLGIQPSGFTKRPNRPIHQKITSIINIYI